MPTALTVGASNLETRRRLNLLDTVPQERFDRFCRLIRHLFNLPNAHVSFALGGGDSMPEISFCNGAIADEDLLVVQNASQDLRFAADPRVAGQSGIRFFAVASLKDRSGERYGNLCITDAEPRAFDDDDRVALQDVVDMAVDEITARRLAVTDDLTGVCNRRGLEFRSEQALALCHRMGKPAVVVMIDLQNLADINAQQGYAEGDRRLRVFADRLIAEVRESDIVARIGGDEFAVLLSGADAVGADNVIGRVRASLDQFNKATASEPGIHFAAGFALYDRALHATVFDALRDADAQMYRAKKAGTASP